MSSVQEGIAAEGGKVQFGNYEAKDKIKASLVLAGDEYAVKTHSEVTRLDKNGALLLEAVPGAVFRDFTADGEKVSFTAEGFDDTDITLSLEPETQYTIFVDAREVDEVRSNLSGKIDFSVELAKRPVAVSVVKVKG
jgi:hypothetical protein